MTEIVMTACALTALWLAYSQQPKWRQWSPVVGLIGQPAWVMFSIDANAWGLLAISLAYTAVYARGAWVQWGQG